LNDITHCIENCLETHRACLQSVTHTLSNGGIRTHEGSALVRALIGCADLCRLHADFMLMGSEYHPLVAGVCAEICERCAEECSHFKDEKLQACAEACRRSAASCREMADTPMHAHSGARPTQEAPANSQRIGEET
jgi:hypothetical protein